MVPISHRKHPRGAREAFRALRQVSRTWLVTGRAKEAIVEASCAHCTIVASGWTPEVERITGALGAVAARVALEAHISC